VTTRDLTHGDAPVPTSAPGPAPGSTGRRDGLSVFRRRGQFSYTVIGVYVFLIVLAILIVPRYTSAWYAIDGILILFLFFLLRYLSTSYSLDDTHLLAWRLPGARRIRLETIRRIEYASMRELGPTSFVGSWGWRGRMWSPSIGAFDAVYTDPVKGILVSGEGVPIYISPTDLTLFARELSRRARSYSGRLTVDVGDPLGATSET